MSQVDVLTKCYIDCYQQLAKHIVAIVHDRDCAAEAMQNLAIHIIEKGDSFPKVKNPKAYLYVCAKNEAMMLLRKRDKIVPADPYSFDINETVIDSKFDRIETEDLLHCCLSEYPADQQDMFIKYVIDGRSPKELAEEFDLKPNTISQRIKRMKAYLKAELLTENKF